MKLATVLSIVFLASTTFGNQNPVTTSEVNTPDPIRELNRVWQEYTTLDGVRIEYRLITCGDGVNVREQNIVVFRFSNQTSDQKTLSWKTKLFRDGECMNCHRIDDSENMHEIILNPNQILESDCSSTKDQSLYIFDNYVKYVPGMTKTRLTDFELTDLTIN